MAERYPLARMSGVIRALTAVMLAIPALFVVLALRLGAPLLVPGVLVAVLYAAIWLAARPAAFELDAGQLRICFPLWRRRLPLASIAGARRLDATAARETVGCALRVGVGGLWGGFGWLWSRRRGWIEMYASRTDGLVWIERQGGLPLLVTPERPDEFVVRLAAGRTAA